MAGMSLLELAEKLVAFDTVSNKTTVPMAEFITDYLRRCGFVIEEYPYEIAGVRKINLIARKGGPNPRLVLAGHMDTVPAGKWDGDPRALTLTREGTYRGRGIADMKLFLAIAMKAGEVIRASELRRPFALCFTSDEEEGCLGAKKLVEVLAKAGQKLGDYVVIGEPTEFYPVYAHKGYVYLTVSVEAMRDLHSRTGGKENPAHSSNPATTTNVVELTMPEVIQELRRFKVELERVRDSRFQPDYPTMNIGGRIIIGRQPDKGGNPDKVGKNIIPRCYTIECDIRPVPGQDPHDLIDILKGNIVERLRSIRTVVLDEKLKITVKAKRAPTYPMETPRGSRVVVLAKEISGLEPKTVSFNTEGYIFNRTGARTVIWGPTDILQAHTENECVPAELFDERKTVDPYVRMIRTMCM